MRLTLATPEAVMAVALFMRDRDYEEFVSATWAESREELAKSLSKTYGNRQDVYVAWSETGEPMAVGGMIELRPNVVTLLFFCTDATRKIFVPITQLFRDKLLPAVEAAGAHRVECVTLGENHKMRAWLERLGLQQEAEHPGFGRNGQTYFTYARTNNVCKAGA